MPLSTYGLISPTELKAYIPISGTGQDGNVEATINRASDLIEAYLDRQIVSRGALTEFHTRLSGGQPFCSPELQTLEWPIISVTSIHESLNWPRVYDASTLLVADTDYQTVKPKGLVHRIGAAGPLDWAAGQRSIRVVYTAGYATTDLVPDRIKYVALRLAALMYLESTKREHGVLSMTDAAGNFTRFGPATLTKEMKADLASERRRGPLETGERDA